MNSPGSSFIRVFRKYKARLVIKNKIMNNLDVQIEAPERKSAQTPAPITRLKILSL